MEVGDRIKGGRWHLDAKLATGGFSVVFAATHRNGSRAAIKVLDTEFTDDEDMRRRFLREGYAANKVGHAGVVRILDDDTTEDGQPYLVMELLDGEALDKRRERLGGKLALSEVLTIADELLDVLVAAHAQGIIHRDIKPANVFLTTKGHVKVLDFGFAKVKEAAQGESTAVGTLLGTPGFMPPERARGQKEEVDARSDIWSVGATLFTIISGEHVHLEANPVLLVAATAQRPARSLESVAPGVPEALVHIIDKALAFEKADRWPSASAMQSALRDVMIADEETKVGPMARAASLGETIPETMPPAAPSPLAMTAPHTKSPLAMTAPRTKSPLAMTTEANDAPKSANVPLPRLYDEADEGGSNKGFTEVLPATRMLGNRPQANEGGTQILVNPAGPSFPQTPPHAVVPVLAAAPPAPAAPVVVAPLRRGFSRAPKQKRSVWPIVIGSALALLGVILMLAALFANP
jgi:serine/threonine protein kinase